MAKRNNLNVVERKKKNEQVSDVLGFLDVIHSSATRGHCGTVQSGAPLLQIVTERPLCLFLSFMDPKDDDVRDSAQQKTQPTKET